MAGGEGSLVDALSGVIGRGGAPASADIICWSSEVPTTGVVFHPAHHPTHWAGVPPGRGKLLPPGTFTGGHSQSNNMGDHPPASQAGGDVNTQPKSVGLGELDGLLCRHRTPGRISTGNNIIQNRESRPAPAGGVYIDHCLPCAQCTNGSGGSYGSHPQTRQLYTETEKQDGGVAHYPAIHSEWNITGGPGMVLCPIILIQHKSPISTLPL